jgi:hypothetical protein
MHCYRWKIRLICISDTYVHLLSITERMNVSTLLLCCMKNSIHLNKESEYMSTIINLYSDITISLLQREYVLTLHLIREDSNAQSFN